MSSSSSPLGPSPQLHPRTGAYCGFHDPLHASTIQVHLLIMCYKPSISYSCADCDGCSVICCSGISSHHTPTDTASCRPGVCHNVSGRSIIMQTWWSSTGMNICTHVLSVPSLCWIPLNILYVSFMGTEFHKLLTGDSSDGIGWHISSCIQSTENK